MTIPQSSQSQVQIKSYPAPSPLATETDLKSEEVQAITEAINPLIADAFALYTKTKNYHWHVAGSHFRDYHKLFDKQAESLLKSIDLLAERVRRIGGTTIRSIGHISQSRGNSDNSDYVPTGEMMRRLMGITNGWRRCNVLPMRSASAAMMWELPVSSRDSSTRPNVAPGTSSR